MMWRITMGGELLYDSRAQSSTLRDITLRLALNEPGELAFTRPLGGPLRRMDRGNEVVVEMDGAEVFRGRVRGCERSWDGQTTVTCEGERAYLNDCIVPPHETGTAGGPPATPNGYLGWLLEVYSRRSLPRDAIYAGELQGDLITPTYQVRHEQRESVWACVSAMLDSVGGYVRIRHERGMRFLDWAATADAVCTQRVLFGRNLLDLHRTMGVGDGWATRIVPVGKTVEVTDPETGEVIVEAGQDVTISGLPDGPLAAGYAKFGDAVADLDAEGDCGVVELAVDYDTPDPSELLNLAVADLRSMSMADTVEVTAIDMRALDASEGAIMPGAFVRVTSASQGTDEWMLCSAATICIDAPDQSTYSLGSVERMLTDGLATGVTVTQVDDGAMDAAIEAQRMASAAQATATQASNLASQAGTNAAQALLDAATAQGTATNAGLAALAARMASVYAECTTAAATAAKVATVKPTTSDFALEVGVKVDVWFSNSNTASAPTLNVNGTGAKPIRGTSGSAFDPDTMGWSAQSTISFVFGGNNWLITSADASMRAAEADGKATSAASAASAADTKATNAASAASAAQSTADGAASAASAAQGVAAEAIDAALGSAFAFCTTAAATADKVATITPATSDWTLAQGRRVTIRFRYGNTAASPTLSVNGSEAKPILGYYNAGFDGNVFTWPAYSTMTLAYTGTYWAIDAAAAYTNAFEATKVATNYLGWTDGEGLTVGDMTAGTLGMNALISASGYYVRSAIDILAAFEATSAHIGIGANSGGIGLLGTRGAPLATMTATDHGQGVIALRMSSGFLDFMSDTGMGLAANHIIDSTHYNNVSVAMNALSQTNPTLSLSVSCNDAGGASPYTMFSMYKDRFNFEGGPVNGVSHAYSAKCSSTKTLTSTTEKVTLNNMANVGASGWLSISSGGIKCAKAGTVLVSANCFFQGSGTMTGHVMAAYVCLGSVSTVKASSISSSGGGWGYAACIAPFLMTVTAGQIIYLAAQDQDGVGGVTVPAGTDTNMTVQYVS